MYLFIHAKEPADAMRLSEAVQLAQFGRAAIYSSFYTNEAGDIRIEPPEEANGDHEGFVRRSMLGHSATQKALLSGDLSAIAESPANGRWVKVPSEYWIRHAPYESTMDLEDGHEFAGAAILFDRSNIPALTRIIQDAERVAAPQEKTRANRQNRRLTLQQRRVGKFFKIVEEQGLDQSRTQEALRESYVAWNAKEKGPHCEPYAPSAFKKWFRRWFLHGERW